MTETLFDSGCLVQLRVSVWTARRQVPTGAVMDRADVDSARIRASKELVRRDAIQAIERVRNDARVWLYAQTLPFPLDGALFVPAAKVPQIAAKLEGYKRDFDIATDAFLAEYPELREEARMGLGPLWNAADYPLDVRGRFAFAWQFVTLAAPGATNILDPAIVEAEQKKFVETMAEARAGAVTELRTRFAACVDHVCERLTGERDNGKPKIFRESMIENFRDFIAGFDSLNICDDKALAALVQRASSALDGVTAADLRVAPNLATELAASMAGVADALDDMLVDRPTRKLRI